MSAVAAYLTYGGHVTITNSTISGNRANMVVAYLTRSTATIVLSLPAEPSPSTIA